MFYSCHDGSFAQFPVVHVSDCLPIIQKPKLGHSAYIDEVVAI